MCVLVGPASSKYVDIQLNAVQGLSSLCSEIYLKDSSSVTEEDKRNLYECMKRVNAIRLIIGLTCSFTPDVELRALTALKAMSHYPLFHDDICNYGGVSGLVAALKYSTDTFIHREAMAALKNYAKVTPSSSAYRHLTHIFILCVYVA